MHQDERLEVFEQAARLRREGVPFALATVTVSQRPTSVRAGAKAIITQDGAVFGWVGGACAQPSVVRHARESIASGESRVIRLSPDGAAAGRDGVVELAMTCHSGGTLEIFIEPFLPEPYLVVAGDSPVARSLLTIGRQLGFRTVSMASGTGDADEHFPKLAFESLTSSRATFVVVASMGTIDEEAVLAALALQPVYLAVVGSRWRFEAIADYLRFSGIDQERIDAIHSPAGVDIRAETPPEIALSILAEITLARRETVIGLPTLAADMVTPATSVVDPICGMVVNLETARWTTEHDGLIVAFCCPACKREYDATLIKAQLA